MQKPATASTLTDKQYAEHRDARVNGVVPRMDVEQDDADVCDILMVNDIRERQRALAVMTQRVQQMQRGLSDKCQFLCNRSNRVLALEDKPSNVIERKESSTEIMQMVGQLSQAQHQITQASTRLQQEQADQLSSVVKLLMSDGSAFEGAGLLDKFNRKTLMTPEEVGYEPEYASIPLNVSENTDDAVTLANELAETIFR